ncbi:A/G-specific adenine glycosylase [Propylenella binzhouense]|uniref:Adenine DNA glycosylase n=1 Tax=Propylenella binzhouense TaxID=2555902 RepID=A0A964WU01_9HYPH|nr:A/G-specific adenine glycosylase [Propylenella binzhouense]MYZ48577.1 A/G-specific adenine glycosylase [Propylenella binzhouense]
MARRLDEGRPAEKPGRSVGGGVVTADALLAWYDRHARPLPWRVGPAARRRGERPDPYRVWLSEIMLQQTTVAAVAPYFHSFLQRWPDVTSLAAAADDAVMAAWAGLGYYSRARNLIAAARKVAERGAFPSSAAELAELPGIGGYTSAAIAAIAFAEPVPVVDGNVERVMSRIHAVARPLPAAKAEIRDRLAPLVPADRPGEFAEALMDLGATICTPKRPACALCPWQDGCAAFAAGLQESFPVKAPKPARPVRHGLAYVAVRSDGAVLLRRRPPKGLLGGMAEVPGSAWGAEPASAFEPPLPGSWERVDRSVTHVFTHFELRLTVLRGDCSARAAAPPACWWSPPDALGHEALPSVMRKAISAACPNAFGKDRP